MQAVVDNLFLYCTIEHHHVSTFTIQIDCTNDINFLSVQVYNSDNNSFPVVSFLLIMDCVNDTPYALLLGLLHINSIGFLALKITKLNSRL